MMKLTTHRSLPISNRLAVAAAAVLMVTSFAQVDTKDSVDQQALASQQVASTQVAEQTETSAKKSGGQKGQSGLSLSRLLFNRG